jgi:hypothetical protein
MSTPNFIIICPAILELKQVDRQTWSVLYAFISCTQCKEFIIIDIDLLLSFI